MTVNTHPGTNVKFSNTDKTHIEILPGLNKLLPVQGSSEIIGWTRKSCIQYHFSKKLPTPCLLQWNLTWVFLLQDMEDITKQKAELGHKKSTPLHPSFLLGFERYPVLIQLQKMCWGTHLCVITFKTCTIKSHPTK